MEPALEKTLIVWRRLGKEHGEYSGFRINSSETVDAHIRDKVDAFRETPENSWRWWKYSDGLLVEKPLIPLDSAAFTENTLIYYFPKQNWVIMQDVLLRMYRSESWYIHVGDVEYEERYRCWVFTDLFCDVTVAPNGKDHTVLDLDDLAYVFELGLVDGETVRRVLRSTQKAVDMVQQKRFPPKEIELAKPHLQNLGWVS
jgi:hypothetical protein